MTFCYKGMRWLKCDLQMQTPADARHWAGDRLEAGEYTWGKNQWENLFDDISENDSGYFLGSIICIQSIDRCAFRQKLELVDGQQRLTTALITFCIGMSCTKKT